jgi:L,D-transpeptidase ErfK/SrfK
VSHGCIRLYPEHIEELFSETPKGTPVELIYEPVKIGFRDGEIFLEVHPDPYNRIEDLQTHARMRIIEVGLWKHLSRTGIETALKARSGVPIRILSNRLSKRPK